MTYNIGFVSTRFSGTDGVSLESSKWAAVFEKNGSKCFWFAGELDKPKNRSFFVPLAHFKNKLIQRINDQVFGQTKRDPEVTELIHDIRAYLKSQLHSFIEKYKIDVLIIENALTIPMNIPLGLAIAETVSETQIPTIAHHHDFCWERTRFSVNAVGEYLNMAFPPKLPNIKHVTINSEAQEQLALRTGISSTVIPNVLDFENPPITDSKRAMAIRTILGLEPDDKVIIQPTRIVQRKGIEHAIKLIKDLKDKRYKLVITHEAGDEGYEYAEWLKEYALDQEVDLRLLETTLEDPWSVNGNKADGFSLWDVYAIADFVTYPSLCEGFGNAFLEAIYFKKPIMINRYDVFVKDIEPLGFKLSVMDGFLSKKTTQDVKMVLDSEKQKCRIVNHNYEVAEQHFSFATLKNQLDILMRGFFGNIYSNAYETEPEQENIVYLNIDQNQKSTNIKHQYKRTSSSL